MEKTTVKERMELTRKLADELSTLLKDGWKLECVHSYVKKRFELKVRDKSSGIDDFSYSYDETFTEGVYEAKEYFTDRLKYLAKEYSDKPKKKSRRDSDSLPSSRPYTEEEMRSVTWMATDPAPPISTTPFTLPPNLGSGGTSPIEGMRHYYSPPSSLGGDFVNPSASQYYGSAGIASGLDYVARTGRDYPSPSSLRVPLPTILDNENVVGDIEYTANGHTNTLTPDIMLQTMRDINNSSELDILY
jgi:hypothetical protein